MKIILTAFFSLTTAISFCQNKKAIVYFDYNKYQLTAASVKTLDSLMLESPEKITLAGFCDSVGNNPYNDWLSLQRNAAVKKYLVSKAVLEKIFTKEAGFGKRKPVNDNADQYKRSLNRRVEIEFAVKSKQTEVDNNKANTNADLETKIKDTSLKLGSNITLHNLNFIGGRHILLPASKLYLAELLELLIKYPGLIIEIQGHICCEYTEPDGFDFDTKTYSLSTNRAMAIYEYLIANGIAPQRLSYKGFGSKHPKVYPEKDESDRIANRRVEIKILGR